jgi:putative transposase
MALILPALKEQNEWMKEINSQSTQQVLMQLESAFHGFFK